MTSGDTTHDTTSTSIDADDMGMQRSTVTAPTAADDTTATRTSWPQNRRPSRVQQSNSQHAAAQPILTPDQHC